MASRTDDRFAGRAAASLAAVSLAFSVIWLAAELLPLALSFAAIALAAGIVAAGRLSRSIRRRRRHRRPGSHWMPAQQRDRGPALRLMRDAHTGRVTGRVIRGVHAGCSLDRLALADVLDLAAGLGPGSAGTLAMIEEYLDQAHPGWDRAADGRGQERERNRAIDAGRMTVQEAYRVLGLSPGATPEQIAEAHGRLIRRVHPDNGGSDELAAQVNAARARLS